MSNHGKDHRTRAQLLEEIENLKQRLDEAEQTIEAIRRGDVDALVVASPHGEQVFSITGAEHIYRVIVETMNEAALTVDPDGTVLFCNQRFCDLMKMPIHEVIGHKVLSFAARPQRISLRSLLAGAQTKALQRRVTLRASDGEDVPVQMAASPLQMDGTTSICLVASDLTELEASANSIRVLREHQQAVEESEARFRTIFESSHDAVVIANGDGFFMQANPAVEAVFGLRPEQIMGRRVSEFLREDIDFTALWQHFLDTGSLHEEMPLIRADSQSRYVETDAVADVLPGRHLFVIRDITERKQAREELQDANEELQEQTEELRVQTEELRVANDVISAREEGLKAANEALLQSEARYRELVQNANSAIMRWTRDGTITFFNEYAQKLFGYSEREAVGKYVGFLVPPHDSTGANLAGLVQDIVKHPERYENHINENICRDGRRVRINWTNRPIFDQRGQVAEILAIGTDVTARVQAEAALRESEERFHRLFEDDLTGNFVSTPEGRILLCNPAFAKTFAFATVNDAVGANMDDLYIDPADRRALLERIKRERQIERLEVWRRRRDGQPIYVVENVVGIFNDQGQLHEIKGYVFDDTERKRAEDALRNLNATLESKVAQRTAELEHRAGQLQRLTLELSQAEDKERQRLAEILHDDLQQIMAAAKFHVSILRSRARNDPSQQATAAQVDHMLAEAIEKSRSLSHELSPTVLHHGDFAETLGWLANEIQAKHGLVVEVDTHGDIRVRSEAARTFLYRAAQELLFNVVKHAHVREAKIRLRRTDGCVVLSVSDRGQGFDPAQLQKTAGFGLFSIRERVELLGGHMKIISVPGQGSTFSIIMPDTEMSETDTGPSPESGGGATLPGSEPEEQQHRLRVLLADDHEIVREGLIFLLREEHSIEVVGEAANGREAIDLTDRLRPDVVIMDVSMPLINGDEATRQIKRHLPQTRVIALSMFDEPETVERMRRAGAEDYVLKTSPSEELFAAIRGRSVGA